MKLENIVMRVVGRCGEECLNFGRCGLAHAHRACSVGCVGLLVILVAAGSVGSCEVNLIVMVKICLMACCWTEEKILNWL